MTETTEEIEEKLSTYKDHYHQIETALREDPENDALLQAKEEIWDVIQLTEELLKLRRKTAIDAVSVQAPVETPRAVSVKKEEYTNDKRQQEDELKVGDKCLALFAGDGKWYPAVINSITDGKFTVTYTGYGDEAEVSPDEITALSKSAKRPLGEREYEYKIGPDGEIEIPKSLKILPTDSEDVRKSKRRRLHAIKYSHRIKSLEQNTNGRKNAWQEFSSKVPEDKGWISHWTKEGQYFQLP